MNTSRCHLCKHSLQSQTDTLVVVPVADDAADIVAVVVVVVDVVNAVAVAVVVSALLARQCGSLGPTSIAWRICRRPCQQV